MAERYNRRMAGLRKRNLELEKTLKRMETLYSLQASETTVASIMRRLGAVTQRPQEVWDAV